MKQKISLSMLETNRAIGWYQSLSAEQRTGYNELHPDSKYQEVFKTLETVPDIGPGTNPQIGTPTKGRIEDIYPPAHIVNVPGQYGIPGVSSSKGKIMRQKISLNSKTTLVSESRKQKHKSPRASFMSKLMTLLGGDTGNAIADAFVKQDSEKFEEMMGDVVKKMSTSIQRVKPKIEK